MNNLWQKINEDITASMRQKDELKLSVLRMVLASLKNKKIELGNKNELNDEQIIQILATEIKKRKDAAAAYKQGERSDLEQREEAEMKILAEYMPPQLSSAEIEAVVRTVINGLEQQNFGQVMSMTMAKLKGQADGQLVAEIVKKVLN